jgi:RNA polymerase sigma factor (sigma-70 family)
MDRRIQNSETRDQNAEVRLRLDQEIKGARDRVADSESGRKSTVHGLESTQRGIAAAIARVVSGDVNAYEEIYAVCDRPLRAFIATHYYWAGPDFVKEVAVRTHEYARPRLGKYDAALAAFQTWYNWQSRAVAKEVMCEWYGPRLVRYDEAVHDVYARTQTGPTDVYEDARLSRVLREEIDTLPEDERQCVVLHDRDGLTFAETASALGLSTMQVRYKRQRALAVLKRRLEERGVRPVEVDSTPAPIWYGQDCTDPDDYAAPTVACLPDGPDTLVGAAAKDKDEG